MMNFKKAIPRRTFLRGVGATIALPLLDGMIPAFAAGNDAAGQPALRLLFMYGPNGRIMKYWEPDATGAAYELPQTLAPLAAYRDRFLVLSGLNIKAADPIGAEPGGNHARPCAAFLTGIHPKPSKAVGISADQVAARELAKHTQLGSLELSLESSDELGAADGAYSDAYTKTISWRSPTTPLPMESNPRKVFERLLGDTSNTDAAARLRQVRRSRSILDFVSDDVSRLSTDLGPNDRRKLDEYLDAVRDIERRIQIAEEQSSRELPTMDRPVGVPPTKTEHAELMFDLMLLAYRGDLTRVISFMWGREQGDPAYRELGIRDGHHSLSHHSGNADAIAACAKIDEHHSKLFAKLLERLQAAPDGTGSLLDHSIILYGSGLSDGNAHTHHDVPMLLAGGGDGQIKGGRHVHYDGVPMSNLLLTSLDMAKVPVEGYLDPKYSDATGELNLLPV
jgi:uncharacterized protein DUF1552